MKVLTIATAWGSKHGGVNVFNYRMCCALSALGNSVTCYVKSASGPDIQDAFSKNVKLLHIGKPSEQKWTPDDIGHVDYDALSDFDLVVVHDIIAKSFIDKFQKHDAQTCIAAFIHTLYSETDYFGDEPDDRRVEKTRAQKALMDCADLVFTSGTWGSERLKLKYPTIADKIKPFVPGRLEMESEPEDSADRVTSADYILSFGRLDLSREQKQANAVLAAYDLLASSFRRDEFPEGADLPKLRLMGVDSDTPAQQRIKKELFGKYAWSTQVEMLGYQHYYDFRTSRSKELIGESKIVVTPSIVETFGLTSLESIQLGIPLVAGRKSGFDYELRRIVRSSPDHAIEWLDPSDYDDLPKSLSDRLRNMLRRYDTYRSDALSLAREINVLWPTWEQSCQTMSGEVGAFRMSMPRRPEVSPNNPFAALARMKIKKNNDPPSQEQDTPSDVEPERQRTLADLARLAYGSNIMTDPALDVMVSNAFRQKTCTELQSQIADALSARRPHDYQDILLCGGTSSGKTTAAELLFGLSNNSDFQASRILYLAPTRALAQERWREWSSRFRDIIIPRCHDNVIISTGEEHDSDRALARGEFLIACLVFEKANVILAAAPELVRQLTMVVVDELHMIADIHRGPGIESLLAKLKYEKRRRQKRDDQQAPLRIVGITTEQSTAAGFRDYLTNIDRDTDDPIPPLTAQDEGRPTKVTHVLVEPISTGECPYRKTTIATLDKTRPLRLTQEEFNAFSARLPISARRSENDIHAGVRGRRTQSTDLFYEFLRDWLNENPFGKRILAFIGSKNDQVLLADRLQAEIKRRPNLHERQSNRDKLSKVQTEVQNDDTSISIETLNRTIDKGIFIHNADINRKLRNAIEDYLADGLPAAAASEIILATETLSYGINISISDVALLSLEFPASERNQEDGAPLKLLSRCAFANMIGRAGRLNQKDTDATVYVWSSTRSDAAPRRLVEIFYCEQEQLRSKIFHGEDKEAFERLKKRGNLHKAPQEFTYPFVKTVLDGLRFTGGAPGVYGATRRNEATVEEIEDEFTDHLLYFHENSENPSNIARLTESVRMIVEGAMDPSLELVRKSGTGYKITPLGSSIIDTGTEISTLEPLKMALEALLNALRSRIRPDAIPVEILLLPIIVQNEAHRQVIANMPEFRVEVARDQNRSAMLAWIVEHFPDAGFDANTAEAMREFLDYCDRNPCHAPSVEIETPLVHDACLRLFCGLLLWVSGEPMASIHARIKKIGAYNGNGGQLNTNFAAVAEKIGWKLLFMGDLMRFTKSSGDVRMMQTKARRLNTRLRLGCAENALPFLARESNRASLITRREAHHLLRSGATPKSIISGDFDFGRTSPAIRDKIRLQVRNYIKNSFHHLKSEFIYGSANPGVDAIARNYWQFADVSIRKATDGGNQFPEWPDRAPEQPEILISGSPGAKEASSPEIRIKEEGNCLRIAGRRTEWRDDKRIPRSVVELVVQASPIAGPLSRMSDGKRNVIVDFPWLLEANPTETDVVRISPAAFGILLTLIVRCFFKDTVSALELVAACKRPISTTSLMDMLYSELTLAQLPDPLFDAWAGYWDAD
ncbi:MAG: DEAD/DEAH box helicase [Pseudomonadota bacterium]